MERNMFVRLGTTLAIAALVALAGCPGSADDAGAGDEQIIEQSTSNGNNADEQANSSGSGDSSSESPSNDGGSSSDQGSGDTGHAGGDTGGGDTGGTPAVVTAGTPAVRTTAVAAADLRWWATSMGMESLTSQMCSHSLAISVTTLPPRI